MIRIAQTYRRNLGYMKIGKIDREIFSSVILQKFGKEDDRVIVPPPLGIDAGTACPAAGTRKQAAFYESWKVPSPMRVRE